MGAQTFHQQAWNPDLQEAYNSAFGEASTTMDTVATPALLPRSFRLSSSTRCSRSLRLTPGITPTSSTRASEPAVSNRST